jgi:hypothetical protein
VRPEPQPIDVLVDGEWVPGWLSSWTRGLDGSWRGNVAYTLEVELSTLSSRFAGPSGTSAMLTWDQCRPAEELRPR